MAVSSWPGEVQCGDRHVFKPYPGGVLAAVVDGLGHGEEAAAAAKKAVSVLEQHAEEPVIFLMERCHDALRAGRGAVMSLASFHMDMGLMAWVGVGNVQGVLLRGGSSLNGAEETLLLRSGVVGVQLPPLQASIQRVIPGDTLVLATDGIRPEFAREIARQRPPQKAAEAILEGHHKGTDDALVLVVRYVEIRP